LFRIDRNIPPVRRWKCKTNGCRATAKTELDQLIRASDTSRSCCSHTGCIQRSCSSSSANTRGTGSASLHDCYMDWSAEPLSAWCVEYLRNCEYTVEYMDKPQPCTIVTVTSGVIKMLTRRNYFTMIILTVYCHDASEKYILLCWHVAAW